MIERNKNKWFKFVVLASILVILAGCQVVDSEGAIISGREINELSPWFDLSRGWLHGLIVLPVGKMLLFFNSYLGMVGAIAIVTIITRVIVFPVTRKSTEAGRLQQKMQPERAAIAEKYRGRTDPGARQQRVYEEQALNRKYGVNMGSSIIGMFISFPIMIAMFYAVQATEIVAQSTIFGVSFAATMSEGLSQFNIAFIAIFILMIVSQVATVEIPKYLNNKKVKSYKRPTTPVPGTGPGMSVFMGLMMAGIGYNMAVALNLYWIISSLVGLVQTLIINNLADRKEQQANA